MDAESDMTDAPIDWNDIGIFQLQDYQRDGLLDAYFGPQSLSEGEQLFKSTPYHATHGTQDTSTTSFPATSSSASHKRIHQPGPIRTPLRSDFAQYIRPSPYHKRPSGPHMDVDSVQGAFYHVPPGSVRGVSVQCKIPPEIASLGLMPLKRPLKPQTTKAAVTSMDTSVTYVSFGCSASCRTKGICIHYQFLCGCRRLPDGMICRPCEDAGLSVETVLTETRKCPYHQDPREDRHLSSRPEDFLASDEQRRRYEEILWRSIDGDWETLASPTCELQGPKANSTMMNFRPIQPSLPSPTPSPYQSLVDFDVAPSQQLVDDFAQDLQQPGAATSLPDIMSAIDPCWDLF